MVDSGQLCVLINDSIDHSPNVLFLYSWKKSEAANNDTEMENYNHSKPPGPSKCT